MTASNEHTVKLYDYHIAGLKTGEYKITASLNIRETLAQDNQTFRFQAGRIRYSIGPEEIQSVFPPKGSTGAYEHALPHVILNSSTLPWEASFSGGEANTPWLALLLLDESELVQVTEEQVDVNGQREKATILTLPGELFHRLFSLPGTAVENTKTLATTLSTLAHVRVASGNGTVTGRCSCLLGNRLPRAGSASVVHLVSFAKDFFSVPENKTNKVILYSLFSFRFHTDATEGDLASRLVNLQNNAAAIHAGNAAMPASPAYVLQQAAFSPLQRAPFNNDPASGYALYRGPLAPAPVTDLSIDDHLPATAADKLQRHHSSGLEDVTYAAAWNLGRYLALSASTFRKALLDWARACSQQLKRERVKQSLKIQPPKGLRAVEHLVAMAPSQKPSVSEALNEQMRTWMRLGDLPFHYLIPSHRLIPEESVRFFTVDENWMKALVNGIFSTGTDGSIDPPASLWNDFWGMARKHWPGGNQPAGCLIHSEIVEHVPGLSVVAKKGATEIDTLHRRANGRFLFILFEARPDELVLSIPANVMHVQLEGNHNELKLHLKAPYNDPIDIPYDDHSGVIKIDELTKNNKWMTPSQFAFHGMKKGTGIRISWR